MSKRPNIIIFNPDQMRADSLAHLGNPASRTPRIDRFAAHDAVSFSNAFCQNPVCVPSRCSFATGLYPHVRGHRTMSYLLREDESSLFLELKNAGYHVWMNARNDLVAGQIPGLVEKHASEIYYGGNAPEAPGPIGAGRGKPGEKNYYSHFEGRLGVDADGRNYGSDDEDLDAAIARIKSRPEDKPLCLFLGLVNPHPPYQVEEPYYSAVDRKKLPPRIRPEECRGKSLMHALIRGALGMEGYTEEDWDEMRACYLGMCMKVDDMFGKLCDALKDAGEYDDSLIVFLSDHGDFTGDYGMPEKAQNTFEDCLTKVPLLIKPPKGMPVDPGVTSSLAELVDFYATVMDYAGVESDHTHFGMSLRPVVANRGVDHRAFVTCEGGRLPEETHCDEFHSFGPGGTKPFHPYYPRHLAQCNSEAHSKGFMIRTDRLKYVARVDGKDELYDLERDPRELVNRIGDESYASDAAVLERDLLRWLMRTTEVVPFDYDSRFSFEMSWAKVKKLVPLDHEEEIRQRLRQGENMWGLMNECRRRFGSRADG